ncbi:MAG: hypothetical protein DRG73_04840 [Deltaproteobacteria bacterium]|nr:MAG: hypothetical protein DRG73_04840 [Deltaproteobacteria bacterium]
MPRVRVTPGAPNIQGLAAFLMKGDFAKPYSLYGIPGDSLQGIPHVRLFCSLRKSVGFSLVDEKGRH